MWWKFRWQPQMGKTTKFPWSRKLTLYWQKRDVYHLTQWSEASGWLSWKAGEVRSWARRLRKGTMWCFTDSRSSAGKSVAGAVCRHDFLRCLCERTAQSLFDAFMWFKPSWYEYRVRCNIRPWRKYVVACWFGANNYTAPIGSIGI